MKKRARKAILFLFRTKPHIPAIILIVLFIIIGAIASSFNFHPSPAPASPSPSPLFEDFHLLIPSLDISAPIIADVDGADEETYNKALEGGVAQLKGSSKPGEGSNIFIFGHSSFYWYKPGEYKKIFSNLDELKEGDEIIIWYHQKEYKYKVVETKLVRPDEVDVIKPTHEEQVSLMTCWPPNTILKRMIVIAK